MTAVSVVMAVYNGEAFLRESIDSVLGQTFTDFEFVVVDDGSSDATAQILDTYRDPRVRVLHNAWNLGHAPSLNRGIRAARSPLIARHDADDIAAAHRLEIQVAAFRAQPGLGLLGAQARSVDAQGRPIVRLVSPKPLTDAGIYWQMLYGSPLVHPSAMFTRESFDAVGGYDERFRRSEDFALWSSISRRCRVANLPDALVSYRHLRAASKTRAAAHDEPYVREVIAENTRHVLDRASAGPALARLIDLWPDHCLALRSPHAPTPSECIPLPVFIDAFRTRLAELHPGDAGLSEMTADARVLLCRTAWYDLRRRRRGSASLAAQAFTRAPAFASGFLMREFAGAAVERLAALTR